MGLVSLRRAAPDDAGLIHSWRCEPSCSLFQPTLPLSLAEVRDQITARAVSQVRPSASGDFQWLIVAEETPVGWVTLKIRPEDPAHGMGEVGYTVSERYRGRGFGRAGVAALIALAFARHSFDLERLQAVAAVRNVASRRVLEGNGFRFEGILRGYLVIRGERVDHAMYGLLRTDLEV